MLKGFVWFVLLELALPAASAQSLVITGRVTRPSGSTFFVDVNLPKNGTYELQRRGSMAPTSQWVTVTTFEAPAGQRTISETIRGSIRFYRLVQFTNPPVLTLQPLSSTNYLPQGTTLRAAVTGTAPLHMRWFRDGVLVPNANSTNLTLAANPALSGAYTFVVTNPYASVTSVVANIKIVRPVAATVAGLRIEYSVNEVQGNFPGPGVYTTRYDPSGFYNTTSSSVFLNDTGNWQYQVLSDNQSRVFLFESFIYPNGQLTMLWQSTTHGAFQLTVPNENGHQLGTFKVVN